jgi:phosphoserine phosphatase RsbU/P
VTTTTVLEQVVEELPIAVVLAEGPELRLALLNRAARDAAPLGRELLGRPLAETLPEVEPVVRGIVESGHPQRFEELALPFADSRAYRGHRFYTLTVTPLGDGGIVVVGTEVTGEVRRRLELERALASENAVNSDLQRALLPPSLPEVPGLRLEARYEPAGDRLEVGGDFYDVVPWAGGGWLLVLGDVVGKGARAASVTARLRGAIGVAADYEDTPEGVLEAVNRQLVGLPPRSAAESFCTAALVLLQPTGGQVRAASVLAGHPAPLVLRGRGNVEELGAAGTALGVIDEPRLHRSETVLRPGDSIVLFSDGLLETTGPRRVLGTEALMAALQASASPDLEELLAELVHRLLPAERRDDVALLAARVES